MKTNICIWVSPGERSRLERLVSDRNTPQKHVWRARIVLLSGDRLGTMAIVRRVGKSKPTVWRWQERFLKEGVDGLLRDRNRGSGRAPLGARVKSLVLTKSDAGDAAERHPLECSHHGQGGRNQPYLRAEDLAEHGLKPHLVSTFKVSNDPRSPRRWRTLSTLPEPAGQGAGAFGGREEQIQALDRTQPGLPMKKGRAGTMTHDYKRNGTTTLFAALNVLDGTVIGQCMKRHRHQEFLRFLRKLDRATPKRLDLHLIVDNYAAHKTPEVKRWLEKTPALPHAFHADLGLLAEPGGTLLRRDHPKTHPSGCLQERPRTGGDHRRLSRQAQRNLQTLQLDRHRPRHLQKSGPARDALKQVKAGTLE